MPATLIAGSENSGKTGNAWPPSRTMRWLPSRVSMFIWKRAGSRSIACSSSDGTTWLCTSIRRPAVPGVRFVAGAFTTVRRAVAPTVFFAAFPATLFTTFFVAIALAPSV